MKTGTKAFLGGAAVLTVAVGAGVYHVQNTVIPERMAQRLNATFDNAIGKNTLRDDLKIRKSGDITVQSTGFFEYKATMPALSLSGTMDGGVSFAAEVKSAEYKLTAVLPLGEGIKTHMDLVSTGPVEFSQNLKMGTGYEATAMETEGACKVIKISVDHIGKTKTSGRQYSFVTDGSDCRFTGFIGDRYDKLTYSSGLSFQMAMANNGADVFSGKQTVTLKDLVMESHSSRGEKEELLKIGRLDAGVTYEGLNTGSKLPRTPGVLNLSDLPENIAFSFDVKDMQLPEIPMFLPKRAPISFGVGLALRGIKGDHATVDLRAGYDLGKAFTAERAFSSPTVSSCKAHFENVPMTKLGDALNDTGAALDRYTSPEGMFGRGGLLDTLQKAGLSVKLDCMSSKGEAYTTTINLAHKFAEGGFPGVGKLEARGMKALSNDLNPIFGPGFLDQVLLPMARPTEDGQGVKWEYSLDKAGNLTVNGNPMGPVLPPMPQ